MTVVGDLALPEVDHTDPELRGAHFHEVLDDLAGRHWLARSPLGYLVLGREQAMDLLRDRRLVFPSVQILELQGIHDGPVYERTRNGLMAKSGDEHSRLRRLVSPAFSARAVDRLRPRLHELLEELWSAVAATGAFDAVDAFARPLPSMVIGELLGLPGEADRLAQWSADLQGIFKLDAAADRAALEAAYLEVYEYVAELVRRRRAEPGDDLVSTLARAEERGDRLSDDECVSLVCSVIAGGTDTTQAQLAHGLRLFAEHPDQWDLLARQPELASAAAAEVLRYEPITPFTARLALDQLERDDVTFPANTVLFVCAATANRDPSVFRDPDRFDIGVDRSGAQSLTFGFGEHFCLGANLARAELADTFAFLAPRLRDLALDGDPLYGPTAGIYTMESVPLRFRAVAA